jgi:hypothetical protein
VRDFDRDDVRTALPRRLRRFCSVALAMYGLSAFSRAARFFALRSITHALPFRLNETSFAFAEPSMSSVIVTVVCFAMERMIVVHGHACLINECISCSTDLGVRRGPHARTWRNRMPNGPSPYRR